jgi:hypothetical protein
MDTFQLDLSGGLFDELMADVSPEFLGFVLIEAVQLIVQDYFLDNGEGVVVDDAIYKCDDPESLYDVAVQHLLMICSENDQTNGVLVPGELYEFSSDAHEQICEKLNSAMLVIGHNHGITDLAVIHGLLSSSPYSTGYNFSVVYIGDRVMFNLSSSLFPI